MNNIISIANGWIFYSNLEKAIDINNKILNVAVVVISIVTKETKKTVNTVVFKILINLKLTNKLLDVYYNL